MYRRFRNRDQLVRAVFDHLLTTVVDSVERYTKAAGPLVDRAIAAGVVRPDLLGRDLAAVVVLTPATAHPGDPAGADRKRYLALLIDGPRPVSTTASVHIGPPGARFASSSVSRPRSLP